jgi:hypothetical protein
MFFLKILFLTDGYFLYMYILIVLTTKYEQFFLTQLKEKNKLVKKTLGQRSVAVLID